MEKIFVTAIMLLVVLLPQSILAQDYYWSAKKKHYLNDVSDKYVIKLQDDEVLSNINIDNVIKLQDHVYMIQKSDKKSLDDFGFKRIISVKMIDSVELIFTGEIVLKPKDGVNIQKIIAHVNNNIYTKSVSEYNTYVMDVVHWDSLFFYSNAIYESGLVDYCHPNFIAPIEVTTVDPLYNQQYYLNSTNDVDINAPEAWSIAINQQPVKVAIIDQGVEGHEDLTNRVINGYTPSTSEERPDTYGKPCYISQPTTARGYSGLAHGQACAGIIAANHNDIGIKGISPTATIVPFNIFNNWYIDSLGVISYRETTEDIANAINNAWNTFGCDVLNNSWSYQTTNSSNVAEADNIIFAINNALSYGRHGKGCVVVFSSGNYNMDFPGVVFPANINGVISVGAIASTGIVRNYSSRGNELCVVAPSGGSPGDIVTTDRMGNLGYNNGNYVYTFNGTSAAAPQVTGVAALVLSVNPNLTALQVKDIINKTAKKVRPDVYTYINDGIHNNGSWNSEVGYGLVDAYAAVKMAQEYEYSDLYIKDFAGDDGSTPTQVDVIWESPDIWIEDLSGNRIDNPHGNITYNVCVRVHNRSDVSSYGTERLFLNWAKAGIDLAWNKNWTSDNKFPCDGAPVKGGIIGNSDGVILPVIAAGGEYIAKIPWLTPMSEDYEDCAEAGSQYWHFCLVARVHDGQEIVGEDENNFGMYSFTVDNNNVAWKNLSIINSISPRAIVTVSNHLEDNHIFSLRYNNKANNSEEYLNKFADVYIVFSEELLKAWLEGGKVSEGVKQVGDREFLIMEPEFSFGNITLEPDDIHFATMNVEFFTQNIPQTDTFDFDLALYCEDCEEENLIGGEHYTVIRDGDKDFKAIAIEDKTVLSGQSASFTSNAIGEQANYVWFNAQGDTLTTGQNLTTHPTYNQQYVLSITSLEDGYKDKDTVSVIVKKAIINTITPNPANTECTIKYSLSQEVSSATIRITNVVGLVVYSSDIDVNQTTKVINLQNITSGQYNVQIISSDEVLDNKTLIVQ